jgi:hypothetical protein
MNVPKALFILLNIITQIHGLRIHIIGISSGLGRELAFQAITEYDDIYVTGMCSNPNDQRLQVPYRNGGLVDKNKSVYFFDTKKIKLYPYKYDIFGSSYDNIYANNYDALVLTTSGSAFERNDFSDKITEETLKNMSDMCEYIQCISAYGVENDWNTRLDEGINGVFEKIGIQGMKDFYLREVYRSKSNQEKILKEYSENNNINVEFFRPKVLSFGETKRAQSREQLARTMLKKIMNNVLNVKRI